MGINGNFYRIEIIEKNISSILKQRKRREENLKEKNILDLCACVYRVFSDSTFSKIFIYSFSHSYDAMCTMNLYIPVYTKKNKKKIRNIYTKIRTSMKHACLS